MQLAVAHVHTNDLGGTVLQQAVGEAAGALPHIEAAQAFDHQPVASRAPSSLSPPREMYFASASSSKRTSAMGGMSSPFLTTLFQADSGVSRHSTPRRSGVAPVSA